MFPDEHHIKIIRRIDDIESELYGMYRRLEGLRLDLQKEWRVLPSGKQWSHHAQKASAHSSHLVTAEDK